MPAATGSMTNEQVLAMQVPWASFQTAGIISKDQLELIYSIDQQPVPSQCATFHAKGAVMVSLFMDILSGINKVRCARRDRPPLAHRRATR